MADTPLSDDYVADILKRDAQRRDQSRYLASGLGSLLSRPRGSAPKPNTRFLRNIVRDADSHNAALRRKEEEESKSRLRDLRREQQRGKRRERSPHPTRDRRHGRDGKSTRRDSRNRSRSRERRRVHSRSKSPKTSPNQSAREHRSRRLSDEPRTGRGRQDHGRELQLETSEGSDSDPLESVIGPKPPSKVQARGRGAHKDSSMDARFDPNYDPKMDVGLEPDEEGDDWDMALEALRDRTKWRKSGAERLRAAGFTDEEVSKWERGGSGKPADGEEKSIEDVRWSKKGQSREWDRGKVVDGERVDVKAEWGRLKDT